MQIPPCSNSLISCGHLSRRLPGGIPDAPAAKDIGQNIGGVLEPYFGHIEANLSTLNPDRFDPGARARLLRWGESDVEGISYDWFGRKKGQRTGNLKFQLRKFRPDVEAGGLTSTRNMARTAENPDQRDTERYWQVALEYSPNGQVDRIVLPFGAPVEYPMRLVDGLRNRDGNVPHRVGALSLTRQGGAASDRA
jgi:hypothetical protein